MFFVLLVNGTLLGIMCVYLDNFCAGERLVPNQASVKGAWCHEQVESAWAMAGVVSSHKKRVAAASCVTELGAEIDGDLRMEVDFGDGKDH